MTKKATDIKVGDILNVNTGYRPLDDEDFKVLDDASPETIKKYINEQG